MKKARKITALLMALALLLMSTGISEVQDELRLNEPAGEASLLEEDAGNSGDVPDLGPDATGAEVADEPLREESMDKPLEEGNMDEPAGEDSEEPMPLPAAPEVVIAPEWEYDSEIGAITIPYVELPESLIFEWTFDGEASGYAVQTAPVPEEDNPEVRGERIYTDEPRIELSSSDYSEGGWFSIYVIAMMDDEMEIEGWKYFRLEQRKNVEEDKQVCGSTIVPDVDDEEKAVPDVEEALNSTLSVHVEKNVNEESEVVLCAVTDPDTTGDICYQWQAVSVAEYDQALFADDLDNLIWQDIIGATTETMNPCELYGDKFQEYYYRVVIQIDDNTKVSEFANISESEILELGVSSIENVPLNTSNWQPGVYTTENIKAICEDYDFEEGMYWSYDSRVSGASTTYKATTHKANTSTSTKKGKPGEQYYEGYEFAGSWECRGFALYLGYLLSGNRSPLEEWDRYGHYYKYGFDAKPLDAAGDPIVGDIIISTSHTAMVYSTYVDSNNDLIIKVVECHGSLNNGFGIDCYFNGQYKTLKAIEAAYGNQDVFGILRAKNNTGSRPSSLNKGTAEFPYATEMYENSSYEVQMNGNLKEYPYEGSANKGSVKKGQTINVIEVVRNSANNIWLQTDKGYFIYGGYKIVDGKYVQAGDQRVKFLKDNSKISIENASYPVGTLQKGKSFDIKGKLTSTNSLEKIETIVEGPTSAKGRTRFTMTQKYDANNKYEIQGTGADTDIKFGSLSSGSYKFAIMVYYYYNRDKTASHPKELYKGSFSISGDSSVAPPSTTKVSQINLNKASVGLDFSQSATLTASVSPTNATNKGVKWSSSNTSIAEIGTNPNGIYVWGRNPGTATITCTAADGGGASAKCEVTVYSPSTLQITGVDYPATYRINSSGWVLQNGTVSSNVNLKELRSVIKSSSGAVIGSEKVQPISGTRYEIKNITAAVPFSKITSAGSYTWTLTASDTSGRSVTLPITFQAVTSGSTVTDGKWGKKYQSVPVASISMDKSIRLNASNRETYTFKPVIAPSNATNKNLKWTTSNSKIATVSTTGVVSAVGEGTATVTCTAADGNGASAWCSVFVTENKKVTGIKLSQTSITLNKSRGETVTLTATVSPSDAANRDVTWKSSNTSVATVSSSGLVTPVAAGSATITCTAADGSGKSASCNVTVTVDIKVSRITLSETELNLVARGAGDNDSKRLTATVLPSNAANQSVTWSSSAPSVATVSSNGTVTAASRGTTIITCTATDGSNVSARCTVTVKFDCSNLGHYFDDNGKCKRCDYVCDHSGDSWHYYEHVIKTRGKPKALDDTFHSTSYTYDVYIITYCVDCGVEGSREKLYSDVGAYEQEAHDFWNEKTDEEDRPTCSVCGYPNPGEVECKHKHPVESTDYVYADDPEYTSLDDKTHSAKVIAYQYVQCDDCGEILDEGTETITTIEEAHFYEETDTAGLYECYDCGHQIWCKHEKAVKKLPTGGPKDDIEGEEYYLDIGNDLTHEHIQIANGWWECANCGMWLDDDERYPYFEETITETLPHVYDEDSYTCKLCGHVCCPNNEHPISMTAQNAKRDAKQHWWVCSRCEQIVGRANHSFNNSDTCTACGYVCPHDRLEKGKVTERVIGISSVDDLSHSRVVQSGYICPDCGTSVYNGEQVINTESHNGYTDGICDDCGHRCSHQDMITRTGDVEVSYSDILDSSHSSVTTSEFIDVCMSCGYENTHSTTVRQQNVEHSYVDGTCIHCGHSCEHSKLIEERSEEVLSYSVDGAYHIPVLRITTVQNCVYCGEYIGTLVEEKDGTAEAHRYDGDGICTTCKTTRPVIDLIDILSPDVALGIGEKKQISVVHSPSRVDDSVTYRSSAPGIATVGSTGIITPVAAGTAVITAKSAYGEAMDSITVTVTPKPKKITLTTKKLTLGVGDEATVMLKSITPSDASSSITYSSSNKKVATVDEYGNIVALKKGKATITAKTYNGKKAKCTVTVKSAPKSISLNPNSLELAEGQSASIKVKLPKNTAASYSYQVIDGEDNVSINNGVVYALLEGTATIRVTTYNGQSADLYVRILPAPTEVILNTEDLTLAYGKSFKLSPTIDQGKTTFTFVSSNTKIAKVSSSGKITAKKKAGTATITVIAHNGVAATVEVTVVKKKPK